ncbi:hypothetical protein [Pseudalkalibacillus hwajinpoensis]|uniref:hypothetical protein n=1 Tax=Guptibacillus hwajinpoensis TaxID=208199 RepID=UPI003850D73D
MGVKGELSEANHLYQSLFASPLPDTESQGTMLKVREETVHQDDRDRYWILRRRDFRISRIW